MRGGGTTCALSFPRLGVSEGWVKRPPGFASTSPESSPRRQHPTRHEARNSSCSSHASCLFVPKVGSSSTTERPSDAKRLQRVMHSPRCWLKVRLDVDQLCSRTVRARRFSKSSTAMAPSKSLLEAPDELDLPGPSCNPANLPLSSFDTLAQLAGCTLCVSLTVYSFKSSLLTARAFLLRSCPGSAAWLGSASPLCSPAVSRAPSPSFGRRL